MRHRLALGRIVLAGAFILFGVLALFMAMDPNVTGRATMGVAVNITDAAPANCSVTVGPGLNLVALPCITTAQLREGVINGSGIVAMYQYVPGAADPWRVHNPGLPGYVVSDLQHLSRRNGYVLLMDEERTFNFSGLRVFSTNVPVVAGWNLAGYPSVYVKNASDSFASINDSLTQAQTYNNSAGAYIIYPGGGLEYTVPGQAYWINATQGDTWAVTS